MWICFSDMDYALRYVEINKERKDEGKGPLTIYEYKVGFYKPDGVFEQWDQFVHRKEAEDLVHYLNGGCTKECRE